MNKKTSPNLKIALILTVGFLLAITFAGTASAKTITVDDSGRADYRTIQKAVNAAEDGDTIKVAAGVYHETISLWRKHSITLRGENKDTTIIDGDGGTCIGLKGPLYIEKKLMAHHKISGFTIQNGERGILLHAAPHCVISNNIIRSNEKEGIKFDHHGGKYVTIKDNIISKNNVGIELGGSDYITIRNNKISDNGNAGIKGDFTKNDEITNNKITSTTNGIILRQGHNFISNNEISGCTNGVFLKGGLLEALSQNYLSIVKATVSKNTISNNDVGVYLLQAKDNNIINNTILNNKLGICLRESATKGLGDSINNKITDNKINSNTDGVHLYPSCGYNHIADNEILNTRYDIIVNSDYNIIMDNTACEIEDKGDGNQISGNECNQTLTPSPSPTSTSATTPEPAQTPAFEAIFAFAGLLAVAYLLRRRE